MLIFMTLRSPRKMFWIGTRHNSRYEDPCTPDVNTEKLVVFSHSSDIHSRYSQTAIFHHITNEIFSNQLTITIMHQEVVFSYAFVKKVKFCLQKFEIKNENFDCEVYTKPFAKMFTPQGMGKQPCSDHDDQLEVLHLAYHSTEIGIVYLD